MRQDGSQKRLLIAESELNRAHLVEDLAAVAAGLRTLSDRATSIRAIGTSAVGLVVGLVGLSAATPRGPEPGSSWVRTLLDGVGLVAKLWR